MRRLVILGLLLLASATLHAQGFCGNFTYPHQGQDANGTALGNNFIILPADPKGDYPVDIWVPPNATRFSMISWSHTFLDGYDSRTMGMAGSIEHYPLARPSAAHEMQKIHVEFNAPCCTNTQTKNVSLPMFPGDHYVVRVWSDIGVPMPAWLSIGVQACFATAKELNAFREAQK